MRIALGQASPTGTVAGNVAEAIALVRQAPDADLLVLHELFLPGYDLDAISSDPERSVSTEDERLLPLRHECAASTTSVLLGAAVRDDDGRIANALLLFDTDGSCEVVYRKIHLWEDEARVFSAGKQLRVLTVGGLRLGVAICYDAGFPEVARSYGLADVELVVFSSAFSFGDQEHRYNIYHSTRALENSVFLAVVNAIGRHGGDEMFGRSQLFDPQGRLLLELSDGPGVVVHELKPGMARHQGLPYLQDLRAIGPPDERISQ